MVSVAFEPRANQVSVVKVKTSRDENGNYDNQYSDDRRLQKLFQCIYNDLQKNDQFVDRFFQCLEEHDGNTAQKSYTFSDGSSFDLSLALDPKSDDSNILHYLIDRFGQETQDETVMKRFADFVKNIVTHTPSLVRDRLDDGRSPLDEAVLKDGFLEIIRAICEGCMKGIKTPHSGSVSQTIHGPNDGFAQTNSMSLNSVQERIEYDEEGITEPLSWRDLAIPNRDTCLHKAIKMKKDNYINYLLEQIKAANAVDAILGHYNQDGFTPLHLAVDFKLCYGKQLDIVKKLVNLYPESLTMSRSDSQTSTAKNPKRHLHARNRNNQNEGAAVEIKGSLSPYRHFLQTRRKKGDAKSTTARGSTRHHGDLQIGEQIEEFLKLSCMRSYGKNRAVLTEIFPRSLGQIHFDLNPRTEVSQKLLDYISKSPIMKFQSYLQYVYIPNLRVVGVSMEELEKKTWWSSLSRKDYVYIFEWLRSSMGVKKILKIVVEDDPKDPHSDEAIEQAVGSFDVEEWDWMKQDLCSDTIFAAAKNVRDLSLYWSGNRALLKSWAAPDGLAKLKKLQTVRIMTPQSRESRERAEKIIEKFRVDLENSWKSHEHCLEPPKVDIQPISSQAHVEKKLSKTEKEEKGRKEKWLKCMDDFSKILRRYLNNLSSNTPSSKQGIIKVAIIDDGVDVDVDGIGMSVMGGETFYDDKGHWPGFYQSAYGHGTLMARQIRNICPKVSLYVAKLNEVWRDGKPQITAKSAAEAIEWAREKGVDIISISWTIEEPEEKDLLKTAVNKALGQNILLFCASNDLGNLSNIPYPAAINPEKIFKIGSATELGLREDKTQKRVDFVVPGSEVTKRLADENDQGFAGPRSGSSIATARCVGLAAVILQCVELFQLHNKDNPRKIEHTYENMNSMLGRLVDKDDDHHYLRVWEVFDEAMQKAEVGENHEWNIISMVASVFRGMAK
ncbi:subtilisin-like protein [Hypoxylon sp. EC38]|nr:subtilisin-like protein [Hypoxylon sp. EC38]